MISRYIFFSIPVFTFLKSSVSFVFILPYKSDQISPSVVSDSLRPHESQHARLLCPSLSPRVCSNLCPLSWWCHPTILPSITPFFCPQFYPASGLFPISQLFASGGQSTRASATILPVNIQGWFPLEFTDLNSLLSKGLSRDFLIYIVVGSLILWEISSNSGG